ncbi:unnamed protein product [Bemisia tabaci]|uniref:Terpene cyclase/mutase family member n=1 Tax=Bemisia tabaci TaxID=7038 RepID=A0A9P0F0Z9_BEMTA|nr:unnamed protein product [Bemisia tabaci]
MGKNSKEEINVGSDTMTLGTKAPALGDTNLSGQLEAIESRIKWAMDAILTAQQIDGHWCYPCESDATYTAEYIFMARFLGETPNDDIEQKIARYLRRIQLPDGGWSLFKNGPTSVSSSVCAYLALRMIGDPSNAKHMVRARDAILAAGGAEAVNVLTRIRLALQGIISWDATPAIPVEMIFLPKWFPFHLSNMAYWARTQIVPLSVLSSKRGVGRPHGIRIDELFHCPPEEVRLPTRAPHQSSLWFSLFHAINTVLRLSESYKPAKLCQRAIDRAVEWVEERLLPGQGLTGSSTMSIVALLMFDALGYPATYPSRVLLREFIESQILVSAEDAYCQVSMSPMWDTALVAHALLETRDPRAEAAARRGLEWLRAQQILNVRGDWAVKKPHLLPGGWPFQYVNSFYPDIDDTAITVLAMHRADPESFEKSIKRARDWAVGMQSVNGGWGAFEVDNDDHWLNQIPFSDHGHMIDPPYADVTGRCLSMLAQLGELPATSEPSRRGLDFLLKEQEANGSWFGQWGINYTHGTWSALSALNAIGTSHDDPTIQRAVEFLISVQNEDDGWGEDGRSYERGYYVRAPSTVHQTSWALLGLMAAGAVHHPAVGRGIQWLLRMQHEHGTWKEDCHNGFSNPTLPFYNYHGYYRYFPLWALARYRNLKRDGLTRVPLGL